MLIAHIINDDGGVGNVVVNLANHQVKNNKVYIFTTNGTQKFLEKLDNRVKVIKLKGSKLPPMIIGARINFIYKWLKKNNKKEKVVLHAHNVATIGLMANVSNLPLICTIHGLSTFPTAKRTFRTFFQEKAISIIIKRVTKHNGIVVGVSKNTSNYYGKLSNTNLNTIYNGCAKSNYKREEDSNFCFCHVGDISVNKGWDIEIGAFSKVFKENKDKNLKFIFAGRLCNYSEEDINNVLDNYELLEKDSKYLGIVKNVQKEILSKSDVLLLASKSEGLPMCIVEAFSMGIPVIATDVGGIPEIVDNGINGYIIDRNEESLYKKMKELISNKELVNKMKKNALQTYNDNFTDIIMNEKYEKEYIKIYKEI